MSSGLPLEALVRDINARSQAGDRDMQRAEDHYKAAGIHLKEAQARVKEENKQRPKSERITWKDWCTINLSFSDRTARNYIAIADGKKTLRQIQMEAAASMQASREKTAQRCAAVLSPARKTIRAAITDATDPLPDEKAEAIIYVAKFMASIPDNRIEAFSSYVEKFQ